MNKISFLIFLNLLCSTQSFGASNSPASNYQSCLNSLREDGNVMLSEIDDTRRIVYQKKSLYDRELFLIDNKKFYSCGELSVLSSTSTADVLNFDATLVVADKKFPIFVEISTLLTYGAEDLVIRESSSEKKETLNCTEVSSAKFDPAFVETLTARLNGFPLQLKDSVETKKNQERAGIWGADWKAKTAIDSERNSYLRVLKKCAGVPALSKINAKISAELKSIK